MLDHQIICVFRSSVLFKVSYVSEYSRIYNGKKGGTDYLLVRENTDNILD